MPRAVKPAHYRGTYHSQSRKLVARANADPTTKCWRCARTMAEVRLEKPKAKWTAGHLMAGVPNSPLAAECSPCNFSHGGKIGNAKQRAKTERTGLTW